MPNVYADQIEMDVSNINTAIRSSSACIPNDPVPRGRDRTRFCLRVRIASKEPYSAMASSTEISTVVTVAIESLTMHGIIRKIGFLDLNFHSRSLRTLHRHDRARAPSRTAATCLPGVSGSHQDAIKKVLAERKKNKKFFIGTCRILTIDPADIGRRISRSHRVNSAIRAKAVSPTCSKVNSESCCERPCNASSARLTQRRPWTNSGREVTGCRTQADVLARIHQAHFAWQLKAFETKANGVVKCRASFSCAKQKPVRRSGSGNGPLAALVHGFFPSRGAGV